MQQFGKAAKKMLLYMPFEKNNEILVDREWRYLYMYSLGRIGTLKRWFIRAYSYALQQQAKSLTKEHLEKTRNSGNQIKIELKAIEDGEATIAQTRSDGDIEKAFCFYETNGNSKEEKPPIAIRKGKAFERNPFRDAAYGGLVNVSVKGGKKVDGNNTTL
jgi:hypothetical protein